MIRESLRVSLGPVCNDRVISVERPIAGDRLERAIRFRASSAGAKPLDHAAEIPNAGIRRTLETGIILPAPTARRAIIRLDW